MSTMSFEKRSNQLLPRLEQVSATDEQTFHNIWDELIILLLKVDESVTSLNKCTQAK